MNSSMRCEVYFVGCLETTVFAMEESFCLWTMNCFDVALQVFFINGFKITLVANMQFKVFLVTLLDVYFMYKFIMSVQI